MSMNMFTEFIQSIPPTHSENSRWELRDGSIYENGELFNIENYRTELTAIRNYFKEWANMAQLEVQVLLVTNEDYELYYKQFAVLPSGTDNKIVLLPQYNTYSNTIIDDTYWFKTVKGEPIMRIHSHHVLPAYQSRTDFDGLNSGTLEMVLGTVTKPETEVAYWLTRHADIHAKEYVHTTLITLSN